MGPEKRYKVCILESKEMYKRPTVLKDRGGKHLIFDFGGGRFGIVVGYRDDKEGKCPIVWWGDEYQGGSFSTIVHDTKSITQKMGDCKAFLIEGKVGETISDAITRLKTLSKFDIIPNPIY